MRKKSLFNLKRSEDLDFCLSFLSSKGVSTFEHHESSKNYFSAYWFVIQTGFSQNSAAEETFRQKAAEFFSRNLKKLKLENYIIAFVPGEILDKEVDRFFSCLLLISPAGRFFIFSDELFKKQKSRSQKLGRSEIFFFSNLLNVLRNEEAKMDFVRTLLLSAKKSKSTS